MLKNSDACARRLWRMCGMCGLGKEVIEGIVVKHQMKTTTGQDTQHPFISTAPTSSMLAPPAPPPKKQRLVCTLNIAPQLHPGRNTNKRYLYTDPDISPFIYPYLPPLKSNQSNFHLLSSLHTSTLQIILKSKRNYVTVNPITAGESDS
jgi:hypothetical protein